MHEPRPAAEQNGASLGGLVLGFDEAHLGPLRRDDDRLGIGGIVLLALHEGADILGRDQLHLMAEPGEFTGPEMRTSASLHHDDSPEGGGP